MTGQLDHASNPRGRRKAREGERRMHAERQRVKDAPMTAAQIRARLDEIAPFDAGGTDPVTARDLARSVAAGAQMRWTRNLSPYFDGDDEATRRLFHESVGALCSEFACLHLLMALIHADPAKAGEVATQIRDAWDDGGRIGEWLYEHEQALGIDPDEVSRLEEAWQALPEAGESR